MKNHLNLAIFSPLLAFVLYGCASMSTMQTARTTEKDEVGYSFGAGIVKTELPTNEHDTIKLNLPFVEAAARYGVSDNLDIGIKLTIIGTLVIDTKYQFLGNKESVFAGSVGCGLGYLQLTSDGTGLRIFDFLFPFYFSFYPTPWLSVYCSPKSVLRLTTYNGDYGSGAEGSVWYGATGGIRIGHRNGFLLEYSYYKNSSFYKPFLQVTCGFAIGIK
jgi:hypothetical protein